MHTNSQTLERAVEVTAKIQAKRKDSPCIKSLNSIGVILIKILP